MTRWRVYRSDLEGLPRRWSAIGPRSDPDYVARFPTHAEAIAYADQEACRELVHTLTDEAIDRWFRNEGV